MTVAAVILALNPDVALADAAGLPRVRLIAEAAWSGGAMPVVVVSFDPDGAVARALTGAEAKLTEPAPVEGGPVAQICRGIDVAVEAVRDTSAVLIWPARMCWVGPETVTSLIEAHGAETDAVLRPAYHGEPGWPAVVPVRYLAGLRSVSSGLMPEELLAAFVAGHAAPERTIDLGDPGTVHDGSMARSDLPPYEGPSSPAGGHAHEWGESVTEKPEA